MTEREAAIVSAYTGVLIGKFSAMHEYVSALMGRPMFDIEMAHSADEIRDKSRADFLAITVTEEN